MQYEIQYLSENAIEVVFSNSIDDATHEKVMALFHHLRKHPLFYLVDLVPAYTSLTIFYDPFKIHEAEKKSPQQFVIKQLQKILASGLKHEKSQTDLIEIQVCFEKQFAPDLAFLAESKNLDDEEVIRLFCEREYKVYMIGFAPGFPYMGIVNEKIAMPRKEVPRIRVESGSVGIAGNQTGIYPFQTPGGWQIIGRTPVKLFDLNRSSPSLIQAGDRVKFHAIGAEEFSAKKFQHKNYST